MSHRERWIVGGGGGGGGRKDSVVHMVVLSIFIQTGIWFALNLSFSERRHFDILFTSEVQKNDGS